MLSLFSVFVDVAGLMGIRVLMTDIKRLLEEIQPSNTDKGDGKISGTSWSSFGY